MSSRVEKLRRAEGKIESTVQGTAKPLSAHLLLLHHQGRAGVQRFRLSICVGSRLCGASTLLSDPIWRNRLASELGRR